MNKLLFFAIFLFVGGFFALVIGMARVAEEAELSKQREDTISGLWKVLFLAPCSSTASTPPPPPLPPEIHRWGFEVAIVGGSCAVVGFVLGILAWPRPPQSTCGACGCRNPLRARWCRGCSARLEILVRSTAGDSVKIISIEDPPSGGAP